MSSTLTYPVTAHDRCGDRGPSRREAPVGDTSRQPTFAVTKAEYFYDYAGQDPVNGYDLNGTMAEGLTGEEERKIVTDRQETYQWSLVSASVQDACPTLCVVETVAGSVGGVKAFQALREVPALARLLLFGSRADTASAAIESSGTLALRDQITYVVTHVMAPELRSLGQWGFDQTFGPTLMRMQAERLATWLSEAPGRTYPKFPG